VSENERDRGERPWSALADQVAAIAGADRSTGQDGWAFVTATVSRLVGELAEARREVERRGYREFDAHPGEIIVSMSNALAHAGRAIEAAAEALAVMNGGNHE
jgi:hypothetical protein